MVWTSRLITIPMVLMLLAVSVSAINQPMPISVSFMSNGPVNGFPVQMTNQRTGETMTETTDGSGFALIEWSNSKLGWYPGDKITIGIVNCISAKCTVIVQISSNANPIYQIIDTTSEGISSCPPITSCHSPVCPDPTVCPVNDCPTDTTPYASCSSCCAVTDCPVEALCPSPIVCPEPMVCPIEPVCPVPALDWVTTLISFIIGIPVGSVAIYYKNKKTGRYKKVTTKGIKDGTVKKEAN